jgi:hypothetical protein
MPAPAPAGAAPAGPDGSGANGDAPLPECAAIIPNLLVGIARADTITFAATINGNAIALMGGAGEDANGG